MLDVQSHTNSDQVRTLSTICSFCGCGCGLEVTVRNGQIVKVRGDKKSPVNHGETCVKGSLGWLYTQSPKRLTYPLIRRNGKLVRATWDEALNTVAAAISRIRRDYGNDAFGCFSSARATNEVNYLAQKFMRQVIGTNNIDSCVRTCHGPSVAALTTVFGSGAATNPYRDFEDTDLILLWGSNAQEAHPIVFNYIRRGIKNGAKMILVDPRKLQMANAAELWLPVRVGTDIALANAIGHVIIEEGLYNADFVARATDFFDDYKAQVASYTPEYAERITGVPADDIRTVARLYATANRAIIAWCLGVTEHHNGANNVHALINLALLTGHVGKPGCGLMPLRGQNNVQGGPDMGTVPNKLPGFFDVEDEEARKRFEQAWNCTIPPRNGKHMQQMFDAMREGTIKFLYVIGENPMQSDANTTAVAQALKNLDMLVVQDLFLTKTAEMADVVLPAAGWGEVEGTFTNSERGVQRVRKAVDPPGEAKDDIVILQELANRLGANWHYEKAEDVWNELRSLSPSHHGMSYERLDREYELPWPCRSLDEPPTRILHQRLHTENVGQKAKFVPVHYEPPVDAVDENYPFVLITGRRLAFYNTGVTTCNYGSKVKDQEEYLEISVEDAERLNLHDGDKVKVLSRRGEVITPVRRSKRMTPGNLYIAFHFPDQVNTNVLTSDTWDKKSGVTPYKYTAVRIEPLATG